MSEKNFKKEKKKHGNDSETDSDDNDDQKKSQTHTETDGGLIGFFAKSDGQVSAHVGTSNKSSTSFRHVLTMGKIDEDAILSEGEIESERKKERKLRKRVEIKDQEQTAEGGATSAQPGDGQTGQPQIGGGTSLRSFGSDINQLNDRASTDYDLDDLNLNLGTMTIEQDHDDDDETNSASEKHKLKRTVMTILLTQRWRKSWKKSNKRKGKGGKKVVYLPTYRLDPKQNINLIKYVIIRKVKNTFESLIDKHKQYDIEYTPRFLRILAEMIKNDAKSYKMERYKIISYVSILQKKLGQSIQFISKLLGNHDHDQSICLRYDTKSFYAICLLFFVYYE